MNPFLAVSFCLTSAILFASFSILARKALAFGTAYAGVVIGLLVGVPMLGVLSLFVSSWGKLTWAAAGWFCLGGALAPGIARLLLYQGFRYIGVGRTMPLITLAPFLSTLVAMVWLGERPGPAIWGATTFVAAGAALLSVKPVGDADWRRIHLLLPIGHAVALAFASAIRRYALSLTPDPIVGAFIATLSSLPLILLSAPLLPPEERFHLKPGGLSRYVLIGVVNTLGFLFFFTSFRYGPVWLVVPLGYTASLFSLLFARFWLLEEEKITWHKTLGAVLLFMGVVIIVWQAT